MMVQLPHEFILLQGIPVPEKGKYGVGVLFLPKDQAACAACLDLAASVIGREGLDLLAVRDVPVNSEILSDEARCSEPAIKQLFITGSEDQASPASPRARWFIRGCSPRTSCAVTFPIW